MLEEVQELQKQVGALVNWVMEMKDLTQNPYLNGLNVPRILNDLGNYASDLTKRVDSIEQKLLKPETEEDEKADSATVEE